MWTWKDDSTITTPRTINMNRIEVKVTPSKEISNVYIYTVGSKDQCSAFDNQYNIAMNGIKVHTTAKCEEFMLFDNPATKLAFYPSNKNELKVVTEMLFGGRITVFGDTFYTKEFKALFLN
ncbi:hypothetical protein [Salinivibrio sp. MA607]|uniref:hypothetical protein n=1 Tax=Salinivibrio sp. MA607 TaxID=1909457 RepID=UPI0009892DA3|nr:hypothetical protein [Salinivibrio sp. MA607]OOF02691.1 hypothetical protein BZG81_13735 [Salinivibrio sp. MA607]